jgi:hypothetical protein
LIWLAFFHLRWLANPAQMKEEKKKTKPQQSGVGTAYPIGRTLSVAPLDRG